MPSSKKLSGISVSRVNFFTNAKMPHFAYGC
jgi:hypothetical protein